MRAFGIFSLAAAAALSLVPSVFAAPLQNGAVQALPAAGKDIPAVPAPLMARDDDACSAVLVSVKADISVHIDALNGLTADTCTKDNLTTHLKAIVSIFADATVKIQALAGQGVQVDVSVCAQLVADILIALCGALAFVLSIIADASVLLGVIVDVALSDCLCSLIGAILAIVDGLLVALVPLITSIVDVVVKLGLNAVGQLLTIC